jgi:tRNA (cmo5U34)-methyltransferase
MEQILLQFKETKVIGFDISDKMIEATEKKLANYHPRYKLVKFQLEKIDWRTTDSVVDGIVSTLAIHHLDDTEKKHLYADIFKILSPGGIFIVADLIKPQAKTGWEMAAGQWDEEVKKRSLLIDNYQDFYKWFQKKNWNYYSDPNPDEIDKPSGLFDQLKWLEEGGFQDVDVYWMRGGHCLFAGYKKSS